MKRLSILIPTCRTNHLVENVIKSFEKYKPEDLEITYVVVENSNETSYQTTAEGLAKNVKWIQNPTNTTGSYANAVALETGKKFITDEYTFLCHADICITSQAFFTSMFEKIKDGNSMVGVDIDVIRIKAVRQCGILIETEILKKVDTSPNMPTYDVGDPLTTYCRDNNLKFHVFANTATNRSLVENLNEPFKSWGPDCGVDRCINDEGEVIFIHLGRGDLKSKGGYHNRIKKTIKDWAEITKDFK